MTAFSTIFFHSWGQHGFLNLSQCPLPLLELLSPSTCDEMLEILWRVFSNIVVYSTLASL